MVPMKPWRAVRLWMPPNVWLLSADYMVPMVIICRLHGSSLGLRHILSSEPMASSIPPLVHLMVLTPKKMPGFSTRFALEKPFNTFSSFEKWGNFGNF